MKKTIMLIMIFVFVLSVVAPYTAMAGDSSSGKNGWQTMYDEMSGWSWTAGSSKSTKKESPRRKGTEPTHKEY